MANSANGVFISYRRDESGHAAGRLADRLNTRLPSSRVFIDVERINPGEDFSIALTRAVQGSAVLIAIIGPQWLRALHDEDARRFDWVRHEVALALSQGVTVIPVLVDGATMPGSADLPADLQGLSTRNAVTIGLTTFSLDIDRLVGAIMQRIGVPGAARWFRSATTFTWILLLVLAVGFVLLVVGGVNDSNDLVGTGVVIALVCLVLFLVETGISVVVSRRVRRGRNRR